jgi:hypothetical protein
MFLRGYHDFMLEALCRTFPHGVALGGIATGDLSFSAI